MRPLRECVQRLRRAARSGRQVFRAGAAARRARESRRGSDAGSGRAATRPDGRRGSATLVRLEPKPTEAGAPGIGAASVADVVSEANVAAADAADDAAPTPSPWRTRKRSARPRSIACWQPRTTTPVPQLVYTWARGEQHPRSRWWSVAAALALLVLGAQTIHHFRADIAGHSTFGPWLMATYKTLGGELAPRLDVHHYEIIDWVATAEPNSRGIGSLKITARIQNRGPSRQPYPAVQLRLKDRWEAAIGSRMFAPAEYLPRDTPRGRLMSPGETARAEIEVVDPGPDAYGFELDVCIEVEASLVTCGSDEVFL